MASTSTEGLTNATPEAVAYQLLVMVMAAEKKNVFGTQPGDKDHADRAYLLNTYAECLRVVQGKATTP